MTLLHVKLLTILIVTWLSIGIGHTDMQGEWIFDRPCPPEIKAAMQKVGPLYHYRVLHDGTLQVNRGKGWERLRYDRK